MRVHVRMRSAWTFSRQQWTISIVTGVVAMVMIMVVVVIMAVRVSVAVAMIMTGMAVVSEASHSY
jgi:hypothetical protein